MARVGRTLGQSVDAYNSAVGSLERLVLPGARKFTELGLRPGREIEEIAPVEKLAREPRLADSNGGPSDE
jgi:DNA recombination protein RmuC